ncbi:hypothetical protein niasHS_007637 [Heterodera schachtii]|uniref:Protein kinase domain-containing protein n=1 Tax=Heterodera schachtii TaxID=97005 RepID=A0ABD2JPA1_HETSC
MKSLLWPFLCLFSFFSLNIFPFISSASLANKIGEDSQHNSSCSTKVQQKCQCGKHFRNLTTTRIIAGKTYDTLVPLGDGMDGKVEHAFSQSLGRCVAIKTCTEDPTRLSKCTRELKVLERMRDMAPHIVRLEDYETKNGQPCTEGAVMSDFIRTVLIGSEKRRKRRNVGEETENANIDENGSGAIGNNCNEVVLVEELGSSDVEHFLEEMKRKSGGKATEWKEPSLEQIKAMIRQAMDELHQNGIAHRDLHKDNAMLFPLPPLVNHSKQCEEKADQRQREVAKLTVKVIDMVGEAVPKCEEEKARHDDEFSLQDVFKELEEL